MPWTLSELAPGFTAKVNLCLDLLLVIGATFLAAHLSAVDAGAAPSQRSWLACGLAALWMLATLILRYYDSWARTSPLLDAAWASLLVLGVGAALLLLEPRLAFEAQGFVNAVYFVAILWPSVVGLRLLIFRALLRSIRGASSEEILLVGAGALGKATGEDLARSNHRLLGYLQLAGEPVASHLPAALLGHDHELEAFLRYHPISEVYIATPSHRHGEAMQAAITVCERFGVPFALPAYEFRFNRAHCSALSSDGYIHYDCIESKPYQLAVKRLIDLGASAVALAVLSPLLLAVAVAIKLTSKGPVFFRQVRSGLYGRPFGMLKFRSMVVDAEALQARILARNEQDGPVFKIAHDPRVTPLGRFLRKYSIDELPQLLNVLRGEMSIVGPRPPVPSEVAQYASWQRRRLSMRPGLTCLWQVSGRNQISFERWMLLDMEYIDHWSLWADLSLILRTVPVVLTGKGAS